MYGGADGSASGEIDTMIGGAGDDVYYVDNSDDDCDEVTNQPDSVGPSPMGGNPGPSAGGTNIDTVISQVSYTLRANIENLELEGSANLTGTGNELDNLLTGNSGNNLLTGLAGVDILDGGGGADTLDGGTGNDTMGGGTGNDTYIVTGNDSLLELKDQGTDTVQSAVAWTLANQLENLTLTGSNGVNGNGNTAANTLTGNSGANQLKGLNGNDKLLGGGGGDQLFGGAGKDTLTGGAGGDTFVFDTGLSSTDNVDLITDFTRGSDVLRLSGEWFTLLSGQTALTEAQLYAAAGATAAHDADDVIIYNKTTGALFYDPDGQGGLASIQFAKLGSGPNTLGIGDFEIFG
jgi:Ca2+-binding RTX toxin-like protein